MNARAWALVFLLASACSDDPVLLAVVPEPSGHGVEPPGIRCSTSAECAQGSFCDKRACADPAGSCRPFPAVCDERVDPVCGCDGVTYFNDCLRRAADTAAATRGECVGDARACGGPAGACPSGAVCTRLVGSGPAPACDPEGPGRCWVIPATCPVESGGDRWTRCAPPGAPPQDPPPPCVDTCTAIRSGEPHRRELHCP